MRVRAESKLLTHRAVMDIEPIEREFDPVLIGVVMRQAKIVEHFRHGADISFEQPIALRRHG
jgi:hypothetical protein